MAEKDTKGILTESGTNEMEIVEFGIDQSVFGINVIKVREIISPVSVVKLPNSHPCLEGLIQLRGDVIALIDLAKFLSFSPSANSADDKIIITEFNQMKLAFRAHSVERIHRISWEQIEKPSEISQGNETSVIGIVKIEGRIILLLDFEKIVIDINPSLGFQASNLKELEIRKRSDKRIVVAEDSNTLRAFLNEVLSIAGYSNLIFFENGALAWNYLEEIARDKGDRLSEDIQLVITDIEMPQMDGHHLTRRIKEHPLLKQLPVIIFSSLITEELLHKGEKVGADAQLSKPDYLKLAQTLDKLVL
ncbi:MAG: chemotaxis protein CheV [Firmicutes bacterium HGW-Firmicutes-15]|nr:MAG: chemotaxis protein CheV [Firmicutes bacterium HGW-Firmicutes-15]